MSYANANIDSLVFHQPDGAIPKLTMQYLRKVAKLLRDLLGVSSANVMDVNTRQKKGAIFAKMLALWDEAGIDVILGKDYLQHVLYCVLNPNTFSDDDWVTLTYGLLPIRSTYRGALVQAFSFVLLDMHFNRVLTLPWNYTWPVGAGLGSELEQYALLEYKDLPELFRHVRSVYDKNNPLYNGYGYFQRTRTASVATKLLTALGWQDIAEANYEDLEAVYRMGLNERVVTIRPVFLLALLENIYGDRIPISSEGWSIRQEQINKEKRQALLIPTIGVGEVTDAEADLVRQLRANPLATSLQWRPVWCMPDRIPDLLHAGDTAFRFDVWCKLEEAYLRWAKYENEKHVLNSLAYFNIYLFIYLPAWYQAHPGFRVEYPHNPNLLVTSVFVSDIGLPVMEERPLTFVAWLNEQSKSREWDRYRVYGVLKTCEVFFTYLARNSDELPECNKFKQPLSRVDYPKVYRPTGTNKRPIPRRIFAFYLRYIETLIQYFERVLDICLDGTIDNRALGTSFKGNTIDTYGAANNVGLIPVVSFGGAMYPLRYIPNCVAIDYYPLKSGVTCRIPELHALYQIYVAMHTGLRHQHIQWLDVRTFDKDNDGPLREFGKLWVNTDKAKQSGWSPVVSRSVIETLRKQATWRSLIASPAFDKPIYYERNPNTKWGLILPLFSIKGGEPHPDSRYVSAWEMLLQGIHCFLLDKGEDHRLCRLMYASISKEVTGDEYFAQAAKKSSEDVKVGGCSLLKVKSFITPHSSRSSVASHLTAYLPADVIGKYITGQTAATVNYYSVPDEEEVIFESIFQKKHLRTGFYEQSAYAADDNETPKTPRSPYIKADAVNSALARGMRVDVDAAVVSFGCVSMSVVDIDENGIDVLKRTRYAGAAENKTEICPYGNNCPADVLKLTKGHRRCAVCPYAVRSVDHLPAISAKGRQTLEKLSELEVIMDAEDVENRYSANEIDALHEERALLAEEVTAWRLAEEVLEQTRKKLAAGEIQSQWVVGKPEIIERHLKAMAFPSQGTQRLIARLAECIEFPMLESPTIRGQFDLLRRQILANRGNVREAIMSKMPTNPAFECAGLLRSVMDTHRLTLSDVVRLIDTDSHLEGEGSAPLMLTEAVLND
ncbi:hypothetical protein [Zoogloea sp. LCSB751]|uniref:hypothetical protein n=1 Tax=Zoogloea sp. LCSB751 TaxID=1965277 RepID=UPI001115D33B|nr:hypothetical protein [Zoogloea sp. LCSB751]